MIVTIVPNMIMRLRAREREREREKERERKERQRVLRNTSKVIKMTSLTLMHLSMFSPRGEWGEGAGD